MFKLKPKRVYPKFGLSSQGYPLSEDRKKSLTPNGLNTMKRSSFSDCSDQFVGIKVSRRKIKPNTTYLLSCPEVGKDRAVIMLTNHDGKEMTLFLKDTPYRTPLKLTRKDTLWEVVKND